MGGIDTTMPDMDQWARMFFLATRQFGVIARWQALAIGIPASTFDDRVRRECWVNPHPGTWLLPGTDSTAFVVRVSVALVAAGDHGLASGWTGLHLHGILLRPPPVITVVIPWERNRRRLHAVRTVRSRTLIAEDRDEAQGVAVASPERCFLDAGRTDSRARLRTMLIDAMQRRIVSSDDVAVRALLHPKVPGAQRLIAAARDVAAVEVDSRLSDVVHRRLLTAGIVPDARPATVTVPGGRTLHPDITFAGRQVCVECDSLGFHGTQRGLDLDHRKDQGYRQAGWNCLRVGWYRIDTDWDGFVEDVRLALAP